MDTSDDRELEVADMAKRAAQAASARRKQERSADGITSDDVDPAKLADLGKLLEEISAWTPGFTGAMIFHGEAALPVVSLISSGDREAMRRSLQHFGSSVRNAIDLTERDAMGPFVDSVISTSRGAVLVTRFDETLLVVAIKGRPTNVADAWRAISDRKRQLQKTTRDLLPD